MKKKGITLIEIVLSISIFIIILTGMFSAFTRVGLGIGKNASAMKDINKAETSINDVLADDNILEDEYDNVIRKSVNVLGSDVPIYYIEEDIENFLNTGVTKKLKVYKNIPLEY